MSARRVLDPAKLGDHLDRLYRAAWALCGSREQAEDLVQETYARVLARPRVLRRGDDLGYLLRVLRNTFISEHRSRSRRPQSVHVENLELVDAASGPAEVAEARAIYALIAELPDDFRSALIAVDVIGFSYREAARTLRVREGTLTSRLFRARREIASKLRDEEGAAERP